MRNYAIVLPQFWTGETGRRVRAAGLATQLVALYLMTCPSSNMIGLFYLPLAVLAHETGITTIGVKKALGSLSEIGFAHYDTASEIVWVPKMACYQVGERLQERDPRCKGVMREAKKYIKSRFFRDFVLQYREAFNLQVLGLEAPSGGPASPSEGEKPSSIQEQDQDHLQDEDHEQVISSTDESPGSAVCILPIRDGSEYLVRTSEVEQWQEQFPDVNIGSELVQMRAWLIANAPRRKTRGCMNLFIVRWLGRAKQNVTIRKPTADNSLFTKNYRAGIGAVCEDGSAAL